MLASSIREDIREGRLEVGQFLPAGRKLAESHSLNSKTVWRALKQLEVEGLVAAEPRRGYRVLPGALEPGKGFPVAFVMSPRELATAPKTDFEVILLAELQRAAARRGWSLLVVGTQENSYGEVLTQLRNGRISGLLLDTADVELQKLVEQAGVPLVMVETGREDANVDSVVQDGFRGGLLAAAQLLSAGHRRIGWLGLDAKNGNPLVIDRYYGTIAGLARGGVSISRECCAVNEGAAMERAAGELLAGAERPTGIVALWQSATWGLCHAARSLKLKVGRDFDMVGWANAEDYEERFRSLFEPGRLPPAVVWEVASMAETALARLEERRTKPELPTIHLRIPTRLRPGGGAALRGETQA